MKSNMNLFLLLCILYMPNLYTILKLLLFFCIINGLATCGDIYYIWCIPPTAFYVIAGRRCRRRRTAQSVVRPFAAMSSPAPAARDLRVWLFYNGISVLWRSFYVAAPYIVFANYSSGRPRGPGALVRDGRLQTTAHLAPQYSSPLPPSPTLHNPQSRPHPSCH